MVLHLKYAARPSQAGTPASIVPKPDGVLAEPGVDKGAWLMSLRYEFPSEWTQFVQSGKTTIDISPERLPFAAKRVKAVVGSVSTATVPVVVGGITLDAKLDSGKWLVSAQSIATLPLDQLQDVLLVASWAK